MSRIFDGNNANHLVEESFDLESIANEFTYGAWFKLSDTTSTVPMVVGKIGVSKWIDLESSGNWRIRDNSYIYSGIAGTANAWQLVIHRRRSNGSGQYVADVITDGVVRTTGSPTAADLAANAILTDGATIALGKSSSSTTGRIAHAFLFLRALSDTELTSLADGASPGNLDSESRRAYYPMIGASLANEWADDAFENPLGLEMAGTVAVDTADNPTVDAIVAPSSVTVDDSAFEPGKAITGTYANFTAAPTVVTLTDSAGNTLTPAVTINDNAKTFSTAYPARITTGTGTTLLRGSVTLELT